MELERILNLPSGRIFLIRADDGYLIEATEMQDVTTEGKNHAEVRTTNDPHVIWRHLVPHRDKWLLTVSTQRGCTHNCQFCDAGVSMDSNQPANVRTKAAKGSGCRMLRTPVLSGGNPSQKGLSDW
jgi:hypothetical protein